MQKKKKMLRVVERGQERWIQTDEPDAITPVRRVSTNVEPYLTHAPLDVRQVQTTSTSAVDRADALIKKVSMVTLFLAILTGALMVVMSWYPPDYTALGVFFLWVVFAASEWAAVFCLLAILDYRETPASLNRLQWKSLSKIMDREHRNKMRSMYGEDYER